MIDLPKTPTRPKLLILYAANSVHTSTVLDYLDAFKLYSEFEVSYADAVQKAVLGLSLEFFDAVLVHYSVRLCYEDYISRPIADALSEYAGPKILTIQDEYEFTDCARRWMERLKFDVVLTCVPEPYIESIYPAARFPGTKFRTVLTGYVPDWLTTRFQRKPIADRKLDICYRGRSLHFFYGRLGQEKEFIGVEVKRRAQIERLKTDIETNDASRIYGDAWFEFLLSSRCTLGTESGANVFDFDGTLRKRIDQYRKHNPNSTFSEVEQKLMPGLEGAHAIMNQISPKMFESIACGTVLVMFEGTYSGILKADKHYISLKSDFSNWNEVVQKIKNHRLLQEMADRAYDEIIRSGTWSYRAFVRSVDADLLAIRERESFRPQSLVERDPVFALVGLNRRQAVAVNCFNQAVNLEFIEKIEGVPRRFGDSLLDYLVPTFDPSHPGEWVRAAWILFIPLKWRKQVGQKYKTLARKLVRLPLN